MTLRLGFDFTPLNPPESLVDVARACDAHLDELWVWEDCFAQSGLASAAVALAATSRVRVGLGLMPTPLRNPALTAMEIATLHRLFPGRFLPGIGHGVQEWMEQVGGRAASPMTLLREYTTALRDLLDGQEVDVEGRYVTLRRVRLTYPPATGSPLLVGGTGPRTLELAGQLGDGVILSWTSDADLARSMPAIDRGRAARTGAQAGRGTDLVVTVFAATGPDARERAEAEARRWFREPEPGLVAAGSAAEIAAVLRSHAGAGATSVCVQPASDEPDLAAFIAFLGQEVRPLL